MIIEILDNYVRFSSRISNRYSLRHCGIINENIYNRGIFLMIIAFAISIFSLFNFVSGATVNVCGSGCDFNMIQGAINNASDGDIIDVGAGVYIETLVINKSLTLRGAQADVDARGRTENSGISSIIDSN